MAKPLELVFLSSGTQAWCIYIFADIILLWHMYYEMNGVKFNLPTYFVRIYKLFASTLAFELHEVCAFHI